ncbi:hypothetical protein D1006_21490 [Burkholderia stabilis]|uniref:Uncharacterized protein n=1 Tax=Burkholderia stabilis TaxID=95485 RepID=A0A4Q2ADM2_9BURK|nr:ThiF family adenylyltransferase [Burkholderia stabilis]RXV67812.1 hypothetical protein D1006_21490 [Burkholderia stabilis]
MRSTGQSWAFEQLEDIVERSNGALEIVAITEPTQEGGYLTISISVTCSGYTKVENGIPLRPRERLLMWIPSQFPLDIPSLGFAHSNYGKFPHVQWGHSICLYQSVETEWQPGDGMFGFVQRMDEWLRAAAANQLNPVGLPLHPPVAYHDEQALVVVPTINTPVPTPPWWAGYAKIIRENDVCVELGDWIGYKDVASEDRVAPAILLPGDMPFEYPESFVELKLVLEERGISLDIVRLLLTLGVLRNPNDKPLVFVLGAAMRGVAGGELRQHLAAWSIKAEDVLALRTAVLARTDDDPVDERFFNEWAAQAVINWCSVLEDRPEIVMPRDTGTSAEQWRGRRVAILGCGALGSMVAMLLARAGVKTLMLYDKAVVKPGVIVRQVFSRRQIGFGKAAATRANVQSIDPRIEAVARSWNIVRALGKADTTQTLLDADVIINATASVRVAAALEHRLRDWPRKHPPVVSMAIGHQADCGLMTLARTRGPGIALDLDRRLKLELANSPNAGQLFDEFWPAEPRTSRLFQPEPGCSDPTFVGSAADIAILTGRMLNVASEWLTNDDDEHAYGFGMHVSRTPHTRADVPSEVEYAWISDDVLHDSRHGYQIRLAPSAKSAMLGWMRKSERQLGPALETGGVLYGEIDSFLKVIWVTVASGPPPDSVASRNEFICGTLGVAETNEKLAAHSRGSVSFVGMWHTHPGAEPDPSYVDRNAMTRLFSDTDFQGHHFMMLIIGGSSKSPLIAGNLFGRNE